MQPVNHPCRPPFTIAGAPPPVRVLDRAARSHDPQPQHEDHRREHHARQRAHCVQRAQGGSCAGLRLRTLACMGAASRLQSAKAESDDVGARHSDANTACSAPQVTHVVSQTDVVKTLLDNKAAFGATLQATVEQLELDDGACMTGEGRWMGGVLPIAFRSGSLASQYAPLDTPSMINSRAQCPPPCPRWRCSASWRATTRAASA